MRKRRRPKNAFRAVAALLLIAAAASPDRAKLIEGVSLASTVLISPQAALDAIKGTFADKISPEPIPAEPQEPSSEVLPDTESSAPAVVWGKESETPSSLVTRDAVTISPDIPKEYKAPLLREDLSGAVGSPAFAWENARIRNYTDFTQEEIFSILDTPTPIRSDGEGEVEVLIYHTHATESYCPYDSDFYDKRYNWRSNDVTNNMVAVGQVLTDTLRANGIGVIHDTTLHDYPSYDGSYQNSFDTVSRILEENPSIRVVLDVHRDAIERDGSVIVKPVVTIDKEDYAQVMIISNCDDGSGLIPEWRENLRFAAALASSIEEEAEHLTRPILFSHRKYNQQLSTGSLLLEFGSHANTLEEAKRSAAVVGEALARLLLSPTED